MCTCVVQSLEADLILVSGQLRQYASENAELKSTVQTLTSNIQSLEVCHVCFAVYDKESKVVEQQQWVQLHEIMMSQRDRAMLPSGIGHCPG